MAIQIQSALPALELGRKNMEAGQKAFNDGFDSFAGNMRSAKEMHDAREDKEARRQLKEWGVELMENEDARERLLAEADNRKLAELAKHGITEDDLKRQGKGIRDVNLADFKHAQMTDYSIPMNSYSSFEESLGEPASSPFGMGGYAPYDASFKRNR